MLRATLFLTIALSVAGCAAPSNSSAGADPFPPTAQVEALRLPFDAYTFSLADMYTISNAEDLLMRKCMVARGHDWAIIKRPTDLKDLRNRRRYGVIESKIAQFGYHVPAGLLSPEGVELAYDKRDSSLSESATEAAFGPDGCGVEVAGQLRPGGDAEPNLLMQKSSASLRDSQSDPRVTDAMSAWRDCMHRKGLEYQDPHGAMSDPKWWANDSSVPSNEEIAVATTDVDCKNQTGLVDVWHAAEVRIQEQEINQDPAYFQTLRTAMNKELDIARGVLGRS
ncbi:hypothetical protein DMH04_52425 [Kibdelosporangium aridum]|uniref:Uncharacterized protein n=1 Tax=Kibdelosporangium aridum TaxID=2030 RepID=A0A428Y898_KIBAR|nr:hypothetical protein [Kibdelosporangium aridum]RSM63833.1 hypothetical protein DMH04_52425 [Kibdelosporangium aridum]